MPQRDNQRRLIPILAVAGLFAAVLAGSGIWLLRSYMNPPSPKMSITPEAVQQSRAGAAPPVTRETVRTAQWGSGPVFKGKVVDAVTRQPIPDFTVNIGYGHASDKNQSPSYSNNPFKDFHGGAYSMTSRMILPSQYIWFVRIDARGHLPAVSAPMTSGGEVDFELQPGTDVQGVVLDSTGAPAAGATVVMDLPQFEGVNLDLKSLKAPANTFNATTGADGQFDLPPQTGPFAVAAMSEKGYDCLYQHAPKEQLVLHLSAWARVQGRLMIGTRLGANQLIELSHPGMGPGQDGTEISSNYSVKTDRDGNYRFDYVVPGQLEISRLFRRPMGNGHGNLDQETQSQTFTMAGGETLTLNLGGAGRPVVGKLIYPPGVSATDYYLYDFIGVESDPPAQPLPPQMPDDIKTGTELARQAWMDTFSLTPAGKEFVAAHSPVMPTSRGYAMEIGDDGTFRIDDVLPGKCSLQLEPNTWDHGTQKLNTYETSFTVPPVPGGGYSSDPVVLPDIKFTTR